MRRCGVAGLIVLWNVGCFEGELLDAGEIDHFELTRGPHAKVIDELNVYSPSLQFEPPCVFGKCGPSNRLYLFYGGWKDAAQIADDDAIYRAECDPASASDRPRCWGNTKVLDPPAASFRGINDPSLVRMGSGDTAYYIMYMTCYAHDGQGVEGNDVCFSTSWADDLRNWSFPTRLLDNCWLPTATRVGSGVKLWCNGYGANAGVRMYSLGASGVSVNGPDQIGTLVDTDPLYINVDVTYRPELSGYQILAEKGCAGPCQNQIDYLSSVNGSAWTLRVPAVVVPTRQVVRTPAPHPHSHGWVYFGESPNNHGDDNDVVFAVWTEP